MNKEEHIIAIRALLYKELNSTSLHKTGNQNVYRGVDTIFKFSNGPLLRCTYIPCQFIILIIKQSHLFSNSFNDYKSNQWCFTWIIFSIHEISRILNVSLLFPPRQTSKYNGINDINYGGTKLFLPIATYTILFIANWLCIACYVWEIDIYFSTQYLFQSVAYINGVGIGTVKDISMPLT